MGEHQSHLIRDGEKRAVCGTAPVIRLSSMEGKDWQNAWREQALSWRLCAGCEVDVESGSFAYSGPPGQEAEASTSSRV